jgi:N-acetylglucosaminyl-diphospho-decaprenol L-rhamnosyltransferase
MTNLTLAVVNYNSARGVQQLLDSLAGIIDRAVVVDNASSPEDQSALRHVCERHPWVKLRTSATNLGFGAGVNHAVEGLSLRPEERLWIVNPDVIPASEAHTHLLRALDESWDVVSPVLLWEPRASPTVAFMGGEIDFARGATIHSHARRPLDESWSGVRTTEFMTGAAMMLTGEAWLRLGGFRTDYFLYWEDADMSMRAHQLGMRMGICLDARAWHPGNGSTAVQGRSEVYYRYMARNRELFLADWAPAPVSNMKMRALREGEFLRLLSRALRQRSAPLAKARAVLEGRVEGWRRQKARSLIGPE